MNFGDVTDDNTVLLEDVFPKIESTAIYLYDFRDDWKHQLELIEISNPPQNELLPTFISGQNACPQEDCGGTYRYRELLGVLADLTHQEYESVKKWLDPKYNPIAFNRLSIEKGLGMLGVKIREYEKGFK